MNAFSASREDGRSDRRVIFELVESADPNTTFEFPTLISALEEGVTTEVTTARVNKAVRDANKTLLKERRRYLANIRGVGYRMARSDEHLPLALGKKMRAEEQMKAGVELLRHVWLNELTEQQRTYHMSQLLVLDAVCQQLSASEKRHAKQEESIEEMRRQQAEIKARIDRIEQQETHSEAA